MVQQLMLEDPMVKVKKDSGRCFQASSPFELKFYLRKTGEKA